MTLVEGMGPTVRTLSWIENHPPPEGWTGTALEWAALEMPLSRLIPKRHRWPWPLSMLQTVARRSELRELWSEVEERVAELAPRPGTELGGVQLVRLHRWKQAHPDANIRAVSEGER